MTITFTKEEAAVLDSALIQAVSAMIKRRDEIVGDATVESLPEALTSSQALADFANQVEAVRVKIQKARR